jgi:hypothetical protein
VVTLAATKQQSFLSIPKSRIEIRKSPTTAQAGFFLPPSTINAVKSIVCGNIDQNGFQNDLDDPSIAQAVTCHASSPFSIGGNPACECPGPAKYSKGKSSGGMPVPTESFKTTAHIPIGQFP